MPSGKNESFDAFPDVIGSFWGAYILAPVLGILLTALLFVRIVENLQ